MDVEYKNKDVAQPSVLSFDGTSKTSEGCAQDFPYWEDASLQTETIKQKSLAQASPQAIAFWKKHMKAPGKIDASTMTPDEWTARRKFSIGASAAAQATGDCPFVGCTPLDLYNEKVGNPPLFPPNEKELRTRDDLFCFGHVIEEYLRNWVRNRWPNSELFIDTNIYNSADRTFLTANLDGILRLPDGSWVHIEFKSANAGAKKSYENGNIPMHYKRQLIQCQHILNVWTSYIVVFFSRDEVVSTRYDRDLDEEMYQVLALDDFWNRNVLARIPPDTSVGLAENVLQAIRNYGGVADKTAPKVQLQPDLLPQLESLARLNAQISEMEAMARNLKKQKEKLLIPIISAIGDATEASFENGDAAYELTYRPSKPRVSVDMEVLEKEYFDVYQRVVSIPPEGSRPVRMRVIKKGT